MAIHVLLASLVLAAVLASPGTSSSDPLPGNHGPLSGDAGSALPSFGTFSSVERAVGQSILAGSQADDPTATATVTPGTTAAASPTASPASPASTPESCPFKSQGDANCDDRFTLSDYTLWRNQFLGADAARTADFNGDGQVTLADYTIWRNSFLAGAGTPATPTPISTPTPTPTPTSTLTSTPSPTVTVTPPPAPEPVAGVWSGITSQGRPVSFTVDAAGVSAFTLAWSAPGCEPSAGATSIPGPFMITGMRFAAVGGPLVEGTLSFVFISGEFVSRESASGTANIVVLGGSSSCATQEPISWTARATARSGG